MGTKSASPRQAYVQMCTFLQLETSNMLPDEYSNNFGDNIHVCCYVMVIAIFLMVVGDDSLYINYQPSSVQGIFWVPELEYQST